MPFGGKNVDDTLNAIMTTEPVFPEQLSPLLTSLLRGMLVKDPAKRLTVRAVLNHPWTARIPELTSHVAGRQD
ncbi:unnamed protein product [Ectocarpus fasciculatus]